MPTVATMTGPGTATFLDDASAAITLELVPVLIKNHTELMLSIGTPGGAPPGSITASLGTIGTNVSAVAQATEQLNKNLGVLNQNMNIMIAAANRANAQQAQLVANQIKTNNFQTQVTKEALERADLPLPTLPDWKEQAKEAVKDALDFNSVTKLSTMVQSTIEDLVSDTGKIIASTEIFKGAQAILQDQLKSWATVFPPSVREVIAKAKTLSP